MVSVSDPDDVPVESITSMEQLVFLLGKKEIVIQKLLDERIQLFTQIQEMSEVINAINKK